MLKINAVRLEINTNNGLYGTTVEFDSGLNIVQANNTSGKSTVFQAILYALGFEELIGSRGEKTMQSVLKDSVDDGDKTYQVIQSQVELEINNGQETIVSSPVFQTIQKYNFVLKFPAINLQEI